MFKKILFTTTLILVPMPLSVQAQDWTFSTGIDYSTGDYGGGADTEIFYVPLGAQASGDDWSFNVTVPWLSLSGPGVFVDGGAPAIRGGATSESESGLGDISLSATRYLNPGNSEDWGVDVTGILKLPTADDEKGLGTGTTDFAGYIEFWRTVENWTLFTGAGYRVYGESDLYLLDDTAFASLGAVHSYNGGQSWGLSYDFNEAAGFGVEDSHEISTWLGLPLTDTMAIDVYGATGVSGGLDFATGVVLRLRQ